MWLSICYPNFCVPQTLIWKDPKMRSRLLLLPFLLLVPLAIACSSSDPEPTATSEPAATATTSTGTEVDVTLNEWDVQLDSTTLAAGEYSFNVKNDGTQIHELVIVRTDTAIEDVAVSGGVADLEAVGTVLGSVTDMSARAVESLSVALDAGNYLFVCNIPGHFALGMVTEVTVN